MKKFMVLALTAMLAACAHDNCQQERVQPEVAPAPCPCQAVKHENNCGCREVKPEAVACPCQAVKHEVPAPCPCQAVKVETDPCRCAYRPDPCREVLRPRVTETVVQSQPRRKCEVDGQTLNCGCGNCQTFKNQQINYQAEPAAVKVIIPAMPEAYKLAANRTLNRMLRDTSSLYTNRPNLKLYVKAPVAESADLPAGIETGVNTLKRNLANSYTFSVTDDASSADYTLTTKADWFDTPSKNVPAVKYTTSLFDRKGNKINEWVEIIKQTDNNKIWL